MYMGGRLDFIIILGSFRKLSLSLPTPSSIPSPSLTVPLPFLFLPPFVYLNKICTLYALKLH